MRKAIGLAGALFLLAGVSGCGGESHEALISDMIGVIRDTAKTLSEIKDKKSAEEKAPELAREGEALRKLKQRADALKEPLTPEEKKRLNSEYKDRLQEAIDEATKQWDRIRKLPDFKAIEEALSRSGALDAFTYAR
jgi:hypothetical protein